LSTTVSAIKATISFLKLALRSRGASPELDAVTQWSIVSLCFGTAVLIRAAIGIWVPDVVPFATYFPAVALAALIGGFWPGFWTWLLSTFAGLFVSMGSLDPSAITVSHVTSAVLFAAAAGLELMLSASLRDLFWQLRKNENRFRALVEASANTVSVFDASGGSREPQPGWEALSGMAWPTYQGMGWLEAVHEEDRKNASLADRFEVRIRDARHDDWRWFAVRPVALRDAGGNVEEVVASLTDITERKNAEARKELLLGDLRHRLKNFMAVIHALVNASVPKNSPEVQAFAQTFLRRVDALQSAGDLVLKANAQAVNLADVVPAALAPFGSEVQSKIFIEGPRLTLNEQTVGAIALACNELATNAAKYGALSNENGKVSIRWDCTPEGDAERVTFEWVERDGPPVQKPTRRGFGTRIVESAVARERNGKVTLDYRPDGLVCRMTFLRTDLQQPAFV
jgi:PAS domain S-box-containing protein